DDADAADGAAAGHRAVHVVDVLAPAGERRQLEERNAGIEQARDPLARQQLAALLEQRRCFRAGSAGARFDAAPLLDQGERVPAGAAPEWPMPGMPPHMSAMMLTTAPPFAAFVSPSFAAASFSIHWPTHSRANRKPPVRLLRTTVSQPLALIADNGAWNWPPA